MGEVFRARDTRLDRDVAIKVLPELFVADPERVGRFTREAKTLASLNHPNIAAIHGLEEANGITALVLELVDGPTLADRIAQGAIPVDEALPIARQIALAIEAAHDQGIIHRDLKPANIKLRPDGTVKVLDFGLAKLQTPDSTGGRSAGPIGLTQSPTLTSPIATLAGMILGTAAYMAPEQARGKAVDKRADIWAFGCVLFEMLTGRRAFAGDEISDTLAFIITKDADWGALPAATPPGIRRLLRRCLEKDANKRLHDIADARIEIDEPLSRIDDVESGASAPTLDARPTRRRWTPVVAAAVASSAIVGAAVWALVRPVPAQRPIVRLRASAPGEALTINPFANDVAFSPDGKYFVYGVGTGAADGQLYVRALDKDAATPIAGINGRGPFISPDAEWIAYFDGTNLKKVSAHGGPPMMICQNCAAGNRGGTWGPDDSIIFTATNGNNGLFRISAAGGDPVAITTVDHQKGEQGHIWPEFLPTGRRILFTILKTGIDSAEIGVRDLKTGEQKILLRGGTQPHFAPPGHLLYSTAGTLRAIEFDADRLTVTGNPVSVLEHLITKVSGAADFAVSRDGSLVYVSGTAQGGLTLAWIDRHGQEEPTGAPPRAYGFIRLSPDGQRAALDVRDEQQDIWIFDFARRLLTRLTTNAASDQYPVWTPDGQRVVFASNRDGMLNVYSQRADGTGAAERLVASPFPQVPIGFSPDGKTLIVRDSDPKTGIDLSIIGMDGDRFAKKLIATAFNEQLGEVSPDGRWLAYQSNESGREEIHVRPFSDVNSGHWQVSADGGSRPSWARSGRELFYVDFRGRIVSVPVQSGAGLEYGNPTVVVEQGSQGSLPTSGTGRNYDTSVDGKRFLVLRNAVRAGDQAAPPQLNVVLNWTDELARLVPARR